MSQTATSSALREYDLLMKPARDRFAANSALASITSEDVDPVLLELFLIHFSSMGVRMTEPVEGWIRRAALRCEELGLTETGHALRGHAAAEAGHHLMMVRDTHALVARFNASHGAALDAGSLLSAGPSYGAARYIQVHEEVIGGPTPFAQLALECEIESLPVRYGPPLIACWVEKLGQDILGCLSFITEHIVLDVGHTEFNRRQLEKLIGRDPGCVPTLVTAGSAVLDAYGEFLADCLRRALERRRELA